MDVVFLGSIHVTKRLLLTSAGIGLLFALIVIGFVWNEARKEIVFLCSNFGPGTTEQSVITQLDTGSFLRFQRETHSGKNRIYVDSAFNFGLYSCVVELNQGLVVIEAKTD